MTKDRLVPIMFAVMLGLGMVVASSVSTIGSFYLLPLPVLAADEGVSSGGGSNNNSGSDSGSGSGALTPAQTAAGGPDGDCLFNPSLPKCKSDNGKCPDGFFQNEDGNCFPKHDKCPKGYHSHENDETGRCIPNSTPCEPGYIINPSFPECGQKDRICKEHPDAKGCNN